MFAQGSSQFVCLRTAYFLAHHGIPTAGTESVVVSALQAMQTHVRTVRKVLLQRYKGAQRKREREDLARKTRMKIQRQRRQEERQYEPNQQSQEGEHMSMKKNQRTASEERESDWRDPTPLQQRTGRETAAREP